MKHTFDRGDVAHDKQRQQIDFGDKGDKPRAVPGNRMIHLYKYMYIEESTEAEQKRMMST